MFHHRVVKTVCLESHELMYFIFSTHENSAYRKTEFLYVENLCNLACSKIFVILKFLRSWFSNIMRK